jgi:hypothetical protein
LVGVRLDWILLAHVGAGPILVDGRNPRPRRLALALPLGMEADLMTVVGALFLGAVVFGATSLLERALRWSS